MYGWKKMIKIKIIWQTKYVFSWMKLYKDKAMDPPPPPNAVLTPLPAKKMERGGVHQGFSSLPR